MFSFIILIILTVLCLIYDPYIDIAKDSVLLWYNKGIFNTEREYKVLYKRK